MIEVYWLSVALIVFFSPVLFVLAIAMAGFWYWVFRIFDRLCFKKEALQNRSCGIDPRSHPAFYSDKDGNGWIENKKVLFKAKGNI